MSISDSTRITRGGNLEALWIAANMDNSPRKIRHVLYNATTEHPCHFADERRLDRHVQYFQRIFNWRRITAGTIVGNSGVLLVDGDAHISEIVTIKGVIPRAVHFLGSSYYKGLDMIIWRDFYRNPSQVCDVVRCCWNLLSIKSAQWNFNIMYAIILMTSRRPAAIDTNEYRRSKLNFLKGMTGPQHCRVWRSVTPKHTSTWLYNRLWS